MRKFAWCFAGILVVVAAGCGQQQPAPVPGVDGSIFMLPGDPGNALGVIDARKNTKDGEDVVIVGRIGGREDPWGKDEASFLIVDASFKPCNEKGDDVCPIPWDYCCDDPVELRAGMANIRFVDDKGETVQTPARDLLKVKELQTVVVRGKAKRDDKGNMTVLATGLYVRPDKK